MISVSNEYKNSMNKRIRNRSYISVGIGVINQEAQASASVVDNEFYKKLYCSKKNIFQNEVTSEYAMLDNDYIKADGTLLFPPREEEQVVNVGWVSQSASGKLKIALDKAYTIKGMTIDFGSSHPISMQIETGTDPVYVETTPDGEDVYLDETEVKTYEVTSNVFKTTDVFYGVKYIVIKPNCKANQRMRINNVLLGVGLTYSNTDIASCDYTATVSPISDELPAIDFNVTVLDPNNVYDIDSEKSFINFLETKQQVSLLYGIELDSGNVEWISKGKLYLDSWSSTKGKMNFVAKDILSFLDDEYTSTYGVTQRTAFAETKKILDTAGIENYIIDDCLKDITLVNPMPSGISHKEALQLIANASRCILYQDTKGYVCIKANFANNLNKSNITLSSSAGTNWSKLNNILDGATVEYAELMRNFTVADGSQKFLPTSGYGDTGFVSTAISNAQGKFTSNPYVTLTLPTNFQFFGINVDFGGNPPQEIKIKTYKSGTLNKTFTFNNIQKSNCFNADFGYFNKITIEVTKAYPNNRVLINKVSLGDITDYNLLRDNMIDNPVGISEKKTKELYVKQFTFEEKTRTYTEDGVEKTETYYEQVEDDVWTKKTLNTTGQVQYIENQLIHTPEHALLVANWLGNYFDNNSSYSATYRGEPRICAGDIINYESEVVGLIRTDIVEETLSFNGALSGSLELKKAMKGSD